MIDAQYISDALNGKPLRNGGFECDCPVSEHRSAKMIVSDKENGEPLIYCRAGCSFTDLQRELRGRDLWPKKNHTPAENREIRRKIENKEWQSARIWLCVYDNRKDLRATGDDKKYKELTEKFKYKIWATKVFNDLSRRKSISSKQQVILDKAMEILK